MILRHVMYIYRERESITEIDGYQVLRTIGLHGGQHVKNLIKFLEKKTHVICIPSCDRLQEPYKKEPCIALCSPSKSPI